MTTQHELLEFARTYLKSVLVEAAESLDIGFDSSTPFGELGIDSFRVLRIVKALETDFGRLPKTLLFENYHVDDLAAYFVEHHGDTLLDLAVRHTSGREAGNAVVAGRPRAVRPHDDAQTPAMVAAGPVLALESQARADSRLGEWVRSLFETHKNDGSVSRGTRNIAPNLFIGSNRKGYLHYARSQDRVLAYAYTGPEDYFSELAEEFCRHSIDHGLHPNVLAAQAPEGTTDLSFSATPFGVLQRIVGLRDFTLAGASMRRLRYLVQKFEKVGACRTEEVRCGADEKTTQAIVGLIDAWCASRTMVNPLIGRVREEIASGSLDPSHRIFATYVDDVMQNVILISPLAERLSGYLMDLEFYHGDMPLGGLEYAIVQIIGVLVAEGRDVLSLGGTYGCKLENSDRADPEIDRVLDELREQNLFNDAGNLQFKNKFRPENRTILLCRPLGTGDPGDVLDLIMMIADPERMQSPDTDRHNLAGGPLSTTRPAASIAEAPLKSRSKVQREPDAVGADQDGVIEGSPRALWLSNSGFNPLNLSHQQVEIDLKSDSWAQVRHPTIDRQLRDLHSRLIGPVDPQAAIASLFPLPHVTLMESGRAAERVFYRAWPRKGRVIQNLLFPTNLFHQIDNGFTPVELPNTVVDELDAATPGKAELALDAVGEVLRSADDVVLAFVEVGNNASGGHPVSADHLRRLSALLSTRSIPLVVDATRILDNVVAEKAGSDGAAAWAAVGELLSHADAVVASLPKNFGVPAGGLVATRDPGLHQRLQAVVGDEGGSLSALDRKLIGIALRERDYLVHRIATRQRAVQRLGEALSRLGVPVVQPIGAHCVLIDVMAIAEFKALDEPVAAFVAWLYLATGVRAAGHNAGMKGDRPLAGTVRLALPLGFDADEVDDIVGRIAPAWQSKQNIPDLVPAASKRPGDIMAGYALRRYLRPGVVSDQDVAAGATKAGSAAPERPVGATAQGRVDVGSAEEGIAVIGMAGRYPGANSPRELWRLLVDGRDCIEDLPEARVALRKCGSDPHRYRGGFIADVDTFDAGFFGVSERDARIMDPQERHFLEVAYETLEDAGYTLEALSGPDGERDIGVFVGAVWTSYQMLGVEHTVLGRPLNPSAFLWSIANRVSYWMDLHGPSLTLDTACSASLTAIKLACDAIRSGECRAALVGGVNLDLHQSKYEINASGGSLSRTGTCRAFGQGADGYVSGEGVAALLLKPLTQALADGDHVHGVIRSAVVTHSGRTSAYTVPNPRPQTKLIRKALSQAGVDARTIGYIEAHGTGTDLGDTIEIAGLTRAFATDGVLPGECAIGSIKTNIGHLEAASGVVGLQKILLQMSHGSLVPSLHAETLNENIDFASTPFQVQRELASWPEKRVDGAVHPRRAGISAIGIGGANAHLIIEQFIPPEHEAVTVERGNEPRILPFSARRPDQLREVVSRLLVFLQTDANSERPPVDLDDVAFTLAHGRKSFEHRVAVLASDLDCLIARLIAFVSGVAHEDVLVGQVGKADGVTELLDAREREDFVRLMVQRGDPRRLARLWSDGLIVDSRELVTSGSGRRISLPTYPFARTRYWITDAADDSGVNATSAPAEAARATATSECGSCHRVDHGGAGLEPGEVLVEGLAPSERTAWLVRQLLADRLDAEADAIRPTDGLLDIGLTSLDMASLTTEFKARIGADFSPTAFFECRTVAELALSLAELDPDVAASVRVIRRNAPLPRSTPETGLTTEVSDPAQSDAFLHDARLALSLPDGHAPALPASVTSPRVLLTGATGFLGIHLLHALCTEHEDTRVLCLVRAADSTEAWARLRTQAKRFELELDESRIDVICGDLRLARFGLSDAGWEAACDEVDQIIHAAAHVNHIEGYASFREATLGTRELVRLAASHRPKLIQFMSSTAACILKSDDTFAVHEHESFIEPGEAVYGGYGQSKWVQETFIRRASEHGVPYVVYRFGELSGSGRSGLAQTDDMLHRLLRMRLAIGCREKISSDVLDALPVDFAARLIVRTTREPELWNRVVHGTHLRPCPIARVYRMAEQRLGRAFMPVTRQHFHAACMDYVQQVYAASPLDGFVLECVLRDAEGSARQRKIMDGYFAVLFPFSQGNFEAALERLGLQLPDWSDLLDVYFDRWGRDDCDYLAPSAMDVASSSPGRSAASDVSATTRAIEAIAHRDTEDILEYTNEN